jgi:hypothetical protein
MTLESMCVRVWSGVRSRWGLWEASVLGVDSRAKVRDFHQIWGNGEV